MFSAAKISKALEKDLKQYKTMDKYHELLRNPYLDKITVFLLYKHFYKKMNLNFTVIIALTDSEIIEKANLLDNENSNSGITIF